jgi:hypothetical protein
VKIDPPEAPIRTFKTDMALELDELRVVKPPSDAEAWFLERANYGHIRDTSDHMAAVIEV